MGQCGKTVKEQSFFGKIGNSSLAQPSPPRDKKVASFDHPNAPNSCSSEALMTRASGPSAAMADQLLTCGIFGSRTIRKGVVLSDASVIGGRDQVQSLQVVSLPRLCMAPYALIVELLEVQHILAILWREGEMNIHYCTSYFAVKPGFFEASIHGQT